MDSSAPLLCSAFLCLGYKAVAQPVASRDVAKLGALRVKPMSGYKVKSDDYGMISDVYLVGSGEKSSLQFKCVRFHAPTGVNPGDHFVTSSVLKQQLLNILHSEHANQVAVKTSNLTWHGVRCVDASWQYVTKAGQHCQKYERTFVLNDSTYQVYGILITNNVATGWEVKRLTKSWHTLLTNISFN